MDIGIYSEIPKQDTNTVRLVEAIFSRALQMSASDIHIEPLEERLRIRLRIDGRLWEMCSLPRTRHKAVLSRIKVLSDMDIAEWRLPQDGRLVGKFQGRNIDFRISSLPTINGEKLAIRIMDKSAGFLELNKLDFSDCNVHNYQRLINSPNGLILVTGPTGSGKTTTLYSTLKTINNEDINIVTLEDPVECKLEGINQMEVNKRMGIDFATGLRAVVRQDPNIVMLGEIRDKQSARIAVRAALTGHLVFSTLHTNSALGAVNRLLDMGVEAFMLLSGLRGVLAQRLVRRVCEHCRVEYVASDFERQYLGYEADDEVKLLKGCGCEHCRGSGYKGRIAVHELLLMDEKLTMMISKKELEQKQLEYLRQNGYKSLREDGIAKAMRGLTTVEELIRASLV